MLTLRLLSHLPCRYRRRLPRHQRVVRFSFFVVGHFAHFSLYGVLLDSGHSFSFFFAEAIDFFDFFTVSVTFCHFLPVSLSITGYQCTTPPSWNAQVSEINQFGSRFRSHFFFSKSSHLTMHAGLIVMTIADNNSSADPSSLCICCCCHPLVPPPRTRYASRDAHAPSSPLEPRPCHEPSPP